MKKLVVLGMLFTFLFAGQAFAIQNVKTTQVKSEKKISLQKKTNLFTKVLAKTKLKVKKIKQQVKDNIEQLMNSMGSQLQTAIILMVVGLIFFILASAIGGNIVRAVGAIFFVIGALFLLLALL